MSSLTDVECIPRRRMTLFLLIDTSGSMEGAKIGAVNDAVANVLPMLGDLSEANPDAEIQVAALEFSNGAKWLYDEPKLAKDFVWQDVAASGLTSLGEACQELEHKLHRNGGFMACASGSYAPVIILLSDGAPTDDFKYGMKKLRANNWFRAAIKIAIAIGDEANVEHLKDFTGNSEAVITVSNIDALKQIIRIVAVTSSQIGSQSSTAGHDKKADALAVVREQACQVNGASLGAKDSEPPAPEPDDNPFTNGDWD